MHAAFLQDLVYTKLQISESYDCSINNISFGALQLFVAPATSKVVFLSVNLFYGHVSRMALYCSWAEVEGYLKLLKNV